MIRPAVRLGAKSQQDNCAKVDAKLAGFSSFLVMSAKESD
jgi:hypothetical protein